MFNKVAVLALLGLFCVAVNARPTDVIAIGITVKEEIKGSSNGPNQKQNTVYDNKSVGNKVEGNVGVEMEKGTSIDGANIANISAGNLAQGNTGIHVTANNGATVIRNNSTGNVAQGNTGIEFSI